MRYKIRPIGYEDNDPVKIRAAFKAGCGGVIVPIDVPQAVTTEIAAIKTQAAEHLELADKFQTTLHSADKTSETPLWSKPEDALTQTCDWLQAVWARAVAQRFARPSAPGISSRLVTVWLGSGIDLPWHIDKQREDRWYDVHIHVSGEGLIVAAPRRELKMEFSDSRGSPQLKMDQGGYAGIYQCEIDKQLEKKGVEFIRLQPGQALYFNQHCLHKSARGPLEAPGLELKLRAGIF